MTNYLMFEKYLPSGLRCPQPFKMKNLKNSGKQSTTCARKVDSMEALRGSFFIYSQSQIGTSCFHFEN